MVSTAEVVRQLKRLERRISILDSRMNVLDCELNQSLRRIETRLERVETLVDKLDKALTSLRIDHEADKNSSRLLEDRLAKFEDANERLDYWLELFEARVSHADIFCEQLDTRVKAINTNNVARWINFSANRSSLMSSSSLLPLITMCDTPIRGFPKTVDELRNLEDTEVQRLLDDIHEPVGGIEERLGLSLLEMAAVFPRRMQNMEKDRHERPDGVIAQTDSSAASPMPAETPKDSIPDMTHRGDNADIRLDRMQRQLQYLRTGYEKIEARLEGLDASFERLSRCLESVDGRFEEAKSRNDARCKEVSDRLEKTNARLESIDARVDMTEKLGDHAEMRIDRVEAQMRDADTRMDGVEERIEDIETSVSDLEAQNSVISVDGLYSLLQEQESRLRDVEDECAGVDERQAMVDSRVDECTFIYGGVVARLNEVINESRLERSEIDARINGFERMIMAARNQNFAAFRRRRHSLRGDNHDHDHDSHETEERSRHRHRHWPYGRSAAKHRRDRRSKNQERDKAPDETGGLNSNSGDQAAKEGNDAANSPPTLAELDD
ncbi:hypothetical protein F5Y17DRAFT_475604 [Xylariaceae sp. FL0594]|nr:hypothetical protein F5Y17DRAFT_475604 [Xylariaceae sp. FL0594]